MRLSKLARAWCAAKQAAMQSAAERVRLETEQRRKQQQRRKEKAPLPGHLMDASVERFLNVLLGALVAAMIVRWLH